MNFVFFALNIVVLVFIIKTLRLLGRNYITVPGVYLSLSVLPTISLIIPGLYQQVVGRSGIYDYMLSIFLHTFCIGLGLFLSYILLNKGKLPRRVWLGVVQLNDNEAKWIFYGSLLLVVVSFFSQVLTLKSIPILSVFRGDSVADLTMAREGGYKLEGSLVVYLWHFSRMVFAPYLAVLFFIIYYQQRSRRSLFLFVSFLFLAVLHNSLSGAKAPVAMIFLCLAVAYYYMGGKLNIRYAFVFVFLIFLFPFLIEYAYSDDSLLDSIRHFGLKIVERFSFETFDRTLSYFDAYPYYFEYLGGRTNKLFTLFSGQDYFNVQNQIFLMRLGEVKEHLLHGSANAHFIGYMNADFGIIGVVVVCLAIGFILGTFDLLSTKYISGPTGLACYSIMGFVFWKLMGSQPTTVLFSHGALLCLLMIIAGSLKFRSNKPGNMHRDKVFK